MGTYGARQGHAEGRLEVGHVLFMDVVGYSKMMVEDQQQTIEELQKSVKELDEFRAASKDNRLIRLPTGDGMALVFFGDPEAPLRAAVELGRALRSLPAVKLRMGIHSGPVYRVEDINANMNVAGGGVNLAQRVMDCGDSGHILVSEESARFFAQVGEWADCLHNVGKTRVKHGLRLHLYSLIVSEAGNPKLPVKLRRERIRRRGAAAAVLTGLTAGLAALLWAMIRPPQRAPAYPAQLTTNSDKRPLHAAAISPDGKWLAYVEPKGIFVQEIESHQPKALPTPQGASLAGPDWWLAWFPDSTKLVVSGPSVNVRSESLWMFHPFVGPAPHEIAEGAISPTVSPDGTRIAFIDAETQRIIWSADPEGGDRRALSKAPEGHEFDSICWSPASGRLTFLELSHDDPKEDFIGTLDVAGHQTTVFKGEGLLSGPDEDFSGLAWVPDGRIVFVRANQKGSKQFSNIWAIRVDSRSGLPAGQSMRVTEEAAANHSSLSSTSDGKHLAFLRPKLHYNIYMGELVGVGRLASKAEELVSEESNNWVDGWTNDSKSVLFTSDRKGGTRDIFRKSVSGGDAEVIAGGDDVRAGPMALSGGASYLYWSWPKDFGDHPRRKNLTELRLPDGPPVYVLKNERTDSGVRCALGAPICLISDESKDGLNFSELDIQGRVERRPGSLKIPVGDGYDWDLSPDGRSIAAVHSDPSDNFVRILILADGATHQVSVPGWAELDRIAWAADGGGFYLAANPPKKAALLYVDLIGKVAVVWQSDSAYIDRLVPSPDGKHIAFTLGSTGESNAWLMERF